MWRGCSCTLGPVMVLGCDLSEGQSREFLASSGLLPLISSGEFPPLSALFDLNETARVSQRNSHGKKESFSYSCSVSLGQGPTNGCSN